jgi:hypothetical protein
MKRVLTGLFAATLCLAPTFVAPAHAEGIGQEAAEHPRIIAAIREMEAAIKYLEAAPHNFGGHKAAAIAATRAAVTQLNQALAFRAAQDTKHGK